MSQGQNSVLATALGDRYRIERELGAGGMATVYLAQDLKHDRKVAVKVLRPELAAVIGAERFLAEIRTTANLQHPHILPLFDSGAAGSFLFYVMPLIEGESLRDRLNRDTQLPIADAVRIASEVASALDYAHRHGVIHRDIKPENVLLHDGRALVADFGIALAASKAGGSRMTETGMSLGTPQYMSPEQAMGEREITARSDVYALGAMTYEMLVGEPPFTGPTAQSIVAKVVTEHPRSLLPQRHTIPPHVDAAVLTALEKLPADRFATAAQFAEALARPGAVPLRTGSGPIHAASGRNARPAWVLPAAALLLVMAGFAAARPWRVPREGSAVALSVIPSPERLTGSYGENVALSPDGQTIAYIARGPIGRQIFIRRLDSFEAIPVAGTENVFVDPVFSPDGRSLAFAGLGGAEIYRVGITGGRPIKVADGGNCCTLLWTDQGIVYLANLGLMLNPLSGAEARLLAPAGFPGNAVLLPGGRALLNLSDQGGRHVEFIDLKSGKRSKVEGLPEAVEDLHYAEGYLFVQVGTDLWTAPFDPGNGRLTGEAVVLLPQVRTGATGGYRESQSAIAGNTIVFVPANGVNHLVLVSREGRESVIPDTVGSFHRPRFSPDGRRLLMDIARDADRDIWTYDFDQRTLSRLTFVPFAHDATWTPDGNRVLFEGNLQDTVTGIFSQRDDGSGVADTIFPAPGSNSPEALLPDGRILTYATAAATGADVWLVTPHQARPEVLLGTPFSETDLALSRDGRWLAWGSNESGTAEIYLRALAGGSRIRISTNGGTEPVWGRDGTELFYRERGTGGPLVVVRLSLSPLRVISRDTLFEAGQYEEADPHANYDYDPRTDRFIFVRPDMTNEIRLVRDWRALLKQP